jgi:hypothetical protein
MFKYTWRERRIQTWQSKHKFYLWYDMRYDIWYDMIYDMILFLLLWFIACSIYDMIYLIWHMIWYIWYDSWYDMILFFIVMVYCLPHIWYDMIYLLTAIGLTPGGSSTVHIYTQTVHSKIQWNRIHRTEST